MLDFLLVLGQIPGTYIQLSFGQIVLGALGIWLTIRVWRRPALRHKYGYWLRVCLFYIKHFRTLRRLQN